VHELRHLHRLVPAHGDRAARRDRAGPAGGGARVPARQQPTAADVVIVGCAPGAARATRPHAAGARLLSVPCVGAMHSSTVEFLLRGGAGGVLVAGCREHDGRTREGVTWAEQRLFEGRKAELKERVDGRRVRLVQATHLGRAYGCTPRVTAFAGEIEALERLDDGGTARPGGAVPGSGRRRGSPRHEAVLAVLCTAALTLAIAGAGEGAVHARRRTRRAALLVAHERAARENCRQRTQAELEALPVHMRTPEVCSRDAASYRWSVASGSCRPTRCTLVRGGAKGDRPLFVLEERALPPGLHRVRVDLQRTRRRRGAAGDAGHTSRARSRGGCSSSRWTPTRADCIALRSRRTAGRRRA
jgi:coenzyme F420-reducing hydrogenase delta subunit